MSKFSEPATARREAEKLIAAVLAAATIAANANPHWSTGSSECCVCPLCKVIAAVRDPDPEMVERVATGAGDLAAGFASLLRNLTSPSTGATDSWQSATATPPPPKKVVKKAVKAVKPTVKKAASKAAPKKAG